MNRKNNIFDISNTQFKENDNPNFIPNGNLESNGNNKTKISFKVICYFFSFMCVLFLGVWIYVQNQKTFETIKKISDATYDLFIKTVYDNIKDSNTLAEIDTACSFFESAYRTKITSNNKYTNFYISYIANGLYDATWVGVFTYNSDEYIFFKMNILFYPNYKWAEKKIKKLL